MKIAKRIIGGILVFFNVLTVIFTLQDKPIDISVLIFFLVFLALGVWLLLTASKEKHVAKDQCSRKVKKEAPHKHTDYGIPSQLSDYETMKQKYICWQKSVSTGSDTDAFKSATNFLNFTKELDFKKITKYIRNEAPVSSYGFRDHPVFGCIFDDFDFTNIFKTVENSRMNYARAIMAKRDFDKEVSSIPRVKIEKTDLQLQQHTLSEMPEVKYSPIGKHFDIDSKLASFVVVDTETTGLKARDDRIIELSAIRYEEFEPIEVFSSRVNPHMHIPESATNINGIHDEEVKDAPSLDEISSSFIDFVGMNPVVGYNVSFDMKFLYTAGIDILEHRKLYDPCDLSRKVLKSEIDDHKLGTVANYYDIYFNEHNSTDDCHATSKVFKQLLEEYIEL